MAKTFEEWLDREIKSADEAMKIRAGEKAYQMAAFWHGRKEVLCDVKYNYRHFKEAGP